VPPGRGFLVAYTDDQSDPFIPAGVPPKGRPGAPVDALEMSYDTVPFGIYTQNYAVVQPVDIAPGTASINCDLTFDSGAVRTGTVLDPEGRPLVGASMIGRSWRNTQRFSPLEGSDFTVHALSASPFVPRRLIFRHLGKGLGKTLQVGSQDREPINVRLEPTATITGRLFDDLKQPLAGVEVRVSPQFDGAIRGFDRELDPPMHAKTDQAGHFRIDGLVPGLTHKIWATGFKSGPSGVILEGWTPKTGEVKDLGEVRPNGNG
jgi:hypothetical protein